MASFQEPVSSDVPVRPMCDEEWIEVKLLSRGSYGEVSEVLTNKTNVRCALKKIWIDHAYRDMEGSKERAYREMEKLQRLRQLNHQNVVQIYLTKQMQLHNSKAHIAVLMELVHGQTLEDFINASALPETTVQTITRQICDALHYLHSQTPTLIHAKLTCSTVMVTEDRRVKLINFDLTEQFLEQGDMMSETRSAYIPLSYFGHLPPESFFNVYTPRTAAIDIWALGCLVHQMATGGKLSTKEGNVFKILRRLQQHGAPKLPSSCSEALGDFYSNCAAMDPKDRKTAAELLEHKFLQDSSDQKATKSSHEHDDSLQVIECSTDASVDVKQISSAVAIAESAPFIEKWDVVRLLGRGAYGEVHEVVTDRSVRCAAKTVKLPVNLGQQEMGQKFRAPFTEKWDVVRLLGRGAYGEVHEVVTDRSIRCAAKTVKLPVNLGQQEMGLGVDSSETSLCRLRHENIVEFWHIAHIGDSTVVVFMELLSGQSLSVFINDAPMEESAVRRFSKQICNALDYLHSQQPPVIHRDINGNNIIITKRGKVVLIDFDLSVRLLKSATHRTVSSAVPKGTPQFMAPEMLSEDANLDKSVYSLASDIWAFGCTVYHMSVGRPPFSNLRNLLAISRRIDRHGAPQLPEQCSSELRDFYDCCVARNRKDRKLARDLLEHDFLH